MRHSPTDLDVPDEKQMRKKHRPRQKLTTGHRVGRLVLLQLIRDGASVRERFWLCQCDCGKQAEGRESLLAAETKKSCGCLADENRLNNATHGATRGGRVTPEFMAWLNCRNRCYNPKNKYYSYYGGRGIQVCAEWRNSFSQFLADVGPRPSPKHSLDRYPDNNGDYRPGNVRWATREQQLRNTRQNRFLTIDGVTRCLVEWDEAAGLPRGTVRNRLLAGWPVERLLNPRNLARASGAVNGWETRRSATKLEQPSRT